MSKGVRLFYFPDCTVNSLNRYRIWVGRKKNYLNMICMAGLSVILKIVIVNNMYEKGTKWVKFYLSIWFLLLRQVRRLGGFLLSRLLGGLGFYTRSTGRFSPFPERVVGLKLRQRKVSRQSIRKQISKVCTSTLPPTVYWRRKTEPNRFGCMQRSVHQASSLHIRRFQGRSLLLRDIVEGLLHCRYTHALMRTSIQLLHPQPLLLYILDQLLELVHAN